MLSCLTLLRVVLSQRRRMTVWNISGKHLKIFPKYLDNSLYVSIRVRYVDSLKTVHKRNIEVNGLFEKC